MQNDNLIQELTTLTSEQSNPATQKLDELNSLAIVTLMNQQDAQVPNAIAKILPQIAQAVDLICQSFRQNGRLIYVGAGTSGRLGVLDASECPPTFGVNDQQVIGLIAGGKEAMFKAQEGAEDSPALAQDDLQALELTSKDVVVGIAASGRTPYVIGALEYSQVIGATTIALSCNADSPIAQKAQLALTPIVGPEVLAGSTRLKSGTAQKLILNMLTTAAMVQMGKCYENFMVDLKASNLKLKARSLGILMQLTDCNRAQAEHLLRAANGQLKIAILMAMTQLDAEQAQTQLDKADGHLKTAIKNTLSVY
ncbi:N-acetylmuramic acid 6-phosphate etherase [Celerinatantimonas diazotrophica]|uniref:N-acetylmuramic acid 6-phosphate etherase n=1 Tax=Celerinatantimonas diazotrophica TaxID=412034 RepID=A0A4R1JAD3_9GAMM|nr:N-acetylmuramic acid 6-phosphate etherase [Celerinatantimonas diazotrophica]TCK47059.1 N-acetylmuramic acid 6-phosphate etherase [Celerinatantimonas diazotrophica]CAG9295827.1 N-acetylmuramic acid 6-phosphate etherase [Celerinatantimonas diazotrophica]